MSTINFDNNKNLKIAEDYYKCMLTKNFEAMDNYFHELVHFISPLAEIRGKGDVSEAARNFGVKLEDIKIRARFACGDQVMLVYNMLIGQSISKLSASALMNFKDGKIIKIELFYDTRSFFRQ